MPPLSEKKDLRRARYLQGHREVVDTMNAEGWGITWLYGDATIQGGGLTPKGQRFFFYQQGGEAVLYLGMVGPYRNTAYDDQLLLHEGNTIHLPGGENLVETFRQLGKRL